VPAPSASGAHAAGRPCRVLPLGLFGWDYPRLQIRTVAELPAGKGIDYPAIGGGNVTFKSAQQVKAPTGEQLALGDGG